VDSAPEEISLQANYSGSQLNSQRVLFLLELLLHLENVGPPGGLN
jgi:hypothetical protein